MSRDTEPLAFGKYKGKTPEQVADIDPAYVVWLFEEVRPCPVSRSLYLACADAPGDDDADERPGEWR